MEGIDAIRQYVRDKGHNYRENVAVSVNNVAVGTFAVNAKVETNDAFVEIFWDTNNAGQYYISYSYKYQRIQYAGVTLTIDAKDKSGNDIVITVN